MKRLKKIFLAQSLFYFAVTNLVGIASALGSQGPTNLRTVEQTGIVSFVAIGKPSFIKIKGEGKGVSGNATVSDGTVSGTFEFQLSSLSTGIDMRDEHMKDKYLQIGTFPKAKLILSAVKLPSGWSQTKPTAKGITFTGNLELHGKTSKVSGTVDITSDAEKAFVITANFPVKISDFAIDIPTYAGVHVADSVDVSVRSSLR